MTAADRLEWIRLYRSGITGAGVAQSCKVQDVLEVLKALTEAKRGDPALEAEHATNRCHAVARQKSITLERALSPAWRRRIAELTAFVAEHGRMPRQRGGDDAETSIGRWLHSQRSKVAKGILRPQERAALDAVGPWDSRLREIREEARFPGRLQAVIDFKARYRRLPSYRNWVSEDESAMGVWLHTLRQAAAGGRLPLMMKTALDRSLPGWDS